MVTALLTRKQFTIEDYHRMGETGILHEDDRVELIEGEIIFMSPIGSPHAACVKRLNTYFSSLINTKDAIISVQDPLILNDFNEPEPDIVLLKYRDDFYVSKHPNAKDALLVIEVADTSLATDLSVKAPLYAKSRINELWIIDLQTNTLHSYQNSNGETFQDQQSYTQQDTISMLAFPGHSISISSIIGS